MARIDEIVDGIYRISTTFDLDGLDFQFNQFLIDDERPALVHTGMYAMYDDVRGAVGEVLDPGRLAYVILLHFESDECGGMDRFLESAPDSALACSAASVQLNLSGWNYRGRVEGHQDGDVVDLGKHKLRFLETPHVHHWDSMMLFDETTKSVFPLGPPYPAGRPAAGRDRAPRQRDVRLLPRDGDLRPRGARPPCGGPHRATRPRLDTRHARREPCARHDPLVRARATRGTVRLPGEGARTRAPDRSPSRATSTGRRAGLRTTTAEVRRPASSEGQSATVRRIPSHCAASDPRSLVSRVRLCADGRSCSATWRRTGSRIRHSARAGDRQCIDARIPQRRRRWHDHAQAGGRLPR
jgi:hypothetical protein